jgi:hypothetical protein
MMSARMWYRILGEGHIPTSLEMPQSYLDSILAGFMSLYGEALTKKMGSLHTHSLVVGT